MSKDQKQHFNSNVETVDNSEAKDFYKISEAYQILIECIKTLETRPSLFPYSLVTAGIKEAAKLIKEVCL